MAMVDEFLDQLTEDYTSLYKENAVLKSKMKVLVDKVEEYRSTEEAMRKALMTAQRMADDLVKEAERKKAELLQEAEGEARRRKEELERELQNEEYRLAQARRSTAAFVEKVRALYADQDKLLSNLGELCPAQAQAQPAADPVDETVSEIDDNVQRLLAQAMMDATAENLKAEQEEPEPELDDTAEFDPVSDRSQPEDDEEEGELLPEDEGAEGAQALDMPLARDESARGEAPDALDRLVEDL